MDTNTKILLGVAAVGALLWYQSEQAAARRAEESARLAAMERASSSGDSHGGIGGIIVAGAGFVASIVEEFT